VTVSSVVAHRVIGRVRDIHSPLRGNTVRADLLIRTHPLREPVYAVLSVSEIILESRRLSFKVEGFSPRSVQLFSELLDLCLLALVLI
jgi:hypothetical protein